MSAASVTIDLVAETQITDTVFSLQRQIAQERFKNKRLQQQLDQALAALASSGQSLEDAAPIVQTQAASVRAGDTRLAPSSATTVILQGPYRRDAPAVPATAAVAPAIGPRRTDEQPTRRQAPPPRPTPAEEQPAVQTVGAGDISIADLLELDR